MRIAVLAHSFPRFPGDTHGPFVERLSQELAALGHEVYVLVPWDRALEPDPASPLRVESFRYVWPARWGRLGYSRTLRRDVGMRLVAWAQAPLYFAAAPRALARLVRRHSIDLVHAHWILPNGWAAYRALRRTGTPYAVTLHGSDIFMAERNPVFARLAARALAGASWVTSCSPDLRDRLARLAERPEDAAKIVLIPNGTDLPPEPDPGEVAALRARLGVASGEPLVAAVGRMVDKKGFDILVTAATRILEAVPEARLVLAGGGDLLPALQQQVRQQGLEGRVLFPGALSHPEVLALLAASDLFVMPSVRDARGNIDGLPVVVLEAMAAARPVVASDIAGIPLAVEDGVSGLLVPERDPRALAAAVVRLLTDRETARRLGTAARERVRRQLTWEAVAQEHHRRIQGL